MDSVPDIPPFLGPELPIYPQVNSLCRVTGPSVIGSGVGTIRGWSSGTGSANVSLGAPGGTVQGDQMLAFIIADTSKDDGGTHAGGSFVPDPAWTLLAKGDPLTSVGLLGAISKGRLFCYGKTAGASEGASLWTDNDALAVAIVSVGGGGSSPAVLVWDTVPPLPEAPPLVPPSPAVIFAAFGASSRTGGTILGPAGMTDSGSGTQQVVDVNQTALDLQVSYQLVPPAAGFVGTGGAGQMTGLSVSLSVLPAASNVYPAFAGQLSTGTGAPALRDREAVYVFEVNSIALSVGWYDCRLVGSLGGRPLYATACCPAGSSSSSSGR